ncbi:ABC transporter permease [Muricoccus radiodurans]|uniref:ABC transporter permease n=1 Tax=Muricoccus radiodurans TaxID=2231721 RepID=UPI003CE91E28
MVGRRAHPAEARPATAPGLGGIALLWLLLIGVVPLLRLGAEGVLGPAGLSAEDLALWRAAGRSLVVAAGATGLAVVLGIAMVSLLLLREVPGRRPLIFLGVLPLLVPSQVLALAAVQAGTPSSPLLLALGLAPPLGTPNPFHGAGGMILLLGVQGAPLVFLSAAGLVRRLPGGALQAARGLGARPGEALRRVAWPLLWPGALAGAGLAWVAALGNFGVAAVLGIPGRYTVLTVLIWQRLSGGGTTALAGVAAMSLLLAVVAAPGLLAQVFAARRAALPAGGPAFVALPAGRAASVGAWLIGVYLLAVLALPLLSLVTSALAPAPGVPIGWDNVTLRHLLSAVSPEARTLGGLRNSLLLSVSAAFILAGAAVVVALSARWRAVRIVSFAADLAYALPGVCVAVAAILVVLGLPGGGAVYGSLAVVLFAYLMRFQALALRPVWAAAARLDPALDDAARGLGAGVWRRLLTVQVPLLAPALAASGILVALLAVNEVTLSSLLSGPGTQTLGMVVFNLQDGGQGAQAAAVSLISLAVMAALMALAGRAGRRLPPGTLPWRP